MAGSITLRFGNILDGPSDLVVLPCTATGEVSGSVAQSIQHHRIPKLRVVLGLGGVEILPWEGAENIAQYVAFAASVEESMGSSPEVISSIGAALGEFTVRFPEVRVIAAPLLGAGGGGLMAEVVIDALRKGFLSRAESGSTLKICVLDPDVYSRLQKSMGKQVLVAGPCLRVFISYTSVTPGEEDWVIDLARFLRSNGIEPRLDKWHLRRGMDLPQWMCNELILADRVIIISTTAYKAKADGRSGGVGWETMIIQGDLAQLPPESSKYLVVVRSPSLGEGLPVYLRTRYAFHCPPSQPVGSFRQELLQELLATWGEVGKVALRYTEEPLNPSAAPDGWRRR